MDYGIIYCVKNLINNKLYIGQTVRGIVSRRNAHLNDARNKKFDIPFHRAIRKYGKENFEWSIIDFAKDKKDLNEKEKYWISLLSSSNRENGYNATVGGDAFGGKGEENFWYGKTRTEDNKLKISTTLKETRKKLGATRNRAVIQLDMQGNYIAEFKNSAETGYDKKNVNGCCNNKLNSYMGYFWVHKDKYNEKYVKEIMEKYRKKKRNKTVIALSINGEYIKKYESIEQAVSEVGGHGSCITACCKGRQKTAYGYKWVYSEDYI